MKLPNMGISGWSYTGGIFLAFVAGVLAEVGSFSNSSFVAAMPWLLVVLGLIMGLINITASETIGVMIVAILFSLASGVLVLIPAIGGMLGSIFGYIAILSVAVAIPPGVRYAIKKWK